MTLTVVATEVRIGDFRLDIHAKDGNDRSVVIENQLERTDHGHLGQCLVYASGLDASTVIWVAPNFREEFRSARDWLNEHRQRTRLLRSRNRHRPDRPRTPGAGLRHRLPPQRLAENRQDRRQRRRSPHRNPGEHCPQVLFHEVLTDANTRQPAISVPKPQKGNWISFAGSPFGGWGMSISDDRMRVEAYIDTYNADINNALFDEFAAEADSWQAQCGLDLVWERLDDRRASRIAAYRSVEPIATRPASGRSTLWSPCTTP